MNKTKLAIFDFDYTLAKTQEHIRLWSPRGTRIHDGKCYIPVHPSLLNKITTADDEYLNEDSFIEFYGLDIKKTQPIKILLKLLNYYIDNGYSVWILTARPPEAKNDIFKFLAKYNINHSNIEYHGLKNSCPKNKINFILNNISTNIKEIILYEDNQYIIENIKKYFNIPISTYFLYHYGTTTTLTISEE